MRMMHEYCVGELGRLTSGGVRVLKGMSGSVDAS